MSITLRTALLSWLITIATLLTFVMVIIPEQKRVLLENLSSKAHSVAVSLRDVAAASAVNADFSSVVDHCTQMLNGDPSIDYLVITRNDGFSLVHERSGWRQEDTLPDTWRPAKRSATGSIETTPLFQRRVFHYAQPFDYSDIEWGWIHVGLSLAGYDRSVATVYWRTGLLAIFFVVLSLLASILYAKRLVRPILNLKKVVGRIAEGNLSARASIEGGEELASLAISINTMTESLLKRDKSLQSVRFAGERFLGTTDWKGIIGDVLEMIGEAAKVCRVCVFRNHLDDNGNLRFSLCCEWTSAPTYRQIENPALQDVPWYGRGYDRWADLLQKGESISAQVPQLDPVEQELVESLGVISLIRSPILVENVWWGVLAVDECEGSRSWTDAEQDSLRAIADMLGVAIFKQQTQEVLLNAKEAAETASHAKSQFLANMSHEIRTPLNGVLGMIDLLLRTQLNENQLHYAQTARISGEALVGIIDDILDLSKIEAGKFKLEEITFNPHQTVGEVVELLTSSAQQKGLKLISAVAPDVPRSVLGDPGRLLQVLLNIVGNAVKFTERGEVALRLAKATERQDSLRLRFEVQDTGAGIPSKDWAGIFDPFIQADGSTTRRHGGTGLGLAITKQLVEMMGGEIGVHSAVGKGSTFWFTIVAHKSVQLGETDVMEAMPPKRALDSLPKMQRPEGLDAALQPGGATVGEAGASIRVLVAEDNLVNQQVVTSMLEMFGFEVEMVASGREALLAWSRRPYDIVLMDCQMPEMDGYEATQAIRQAEAASNAASRTPIIALTAHAMEGDRERCLAVGMDDYLGKPFTVEGLRTILRHWLPKKGPSVSSLLDRRSDSEGITAPPQLVSPTRPGEGLDSIHAAANGSSPYPHPPNVSATAAMSRFRGLVLVADDDPFIQEVFVNALRRFGCQSEVVANGREALESMERRRFDLVLLDSQMPEMDGCETAKTIREKEASTASATRVPIIAMTGGGVGGGWEDCLAAGFDDHLGKPFQVKELQNILERWLPQDSHVDRTTPVHGAGEMSGSNVRKYATAADVAGSIDRTALDNLRALQPPDATSLLARLVETYLKETPPMMERIRDAANRDDHESVQRTAHSLKSSSAYLGANHLASLFITIEKLAGAKTLEPVREMLPEMFGEFDRVREVLLSEV